MKSIGGYFELICGRTPPYYIDGLYLNLCRSALRYLIRALRITRIHIPLFTCNVVHDAIAQEGCDALSYRIDKDLMPIGDIPHDDFILYNNYYGVIGNRVTELSSLYPNLIVDNAQAFYSQPLCRAIIYSPRKFFGLPDGGILRGKDIPKIEIGTSHSYSLMSHLLKRYDIGAEKAYIDFCKNDKALEFLKPEYMSNLTKALMGNINYKYVKERRINNFKVLHSHLKSLFPFDLSSDDVPLVYPYLVENGYELRQKLINEHVYVATYWPNVLEWTKPGMTEYELTKNLLPLPCDQRYGEEEMNRIIDVINN